MLDLLGRDNLITYLLIESQAFFIVKCKANGVEFCILFFILAYAIPFFRLFPFFMHPRLLLLTLRLSIVYVFLDFSFLASFDHSLLHLFSFCPQFFLGLFKHLIFSAYSICSSFNVNTALFYIWYSHRLSFFDMNVLIDLRRFVTFT